MSAGVLQGEHCARVLVGDQVRASMAGRVGPDAGRPAEPGLAPHHPSGLIHGEQGSMWAVGDPEEVAARPDPVQVLAARHRLQLDHRAHTGCRQSDDARMQLVGDVGHASHLSDALGLRYHLRQLGDRDRTTHHGDVPVTVLADEHCPVVRHVEKIVGDVQTGGQNLDRADLPHALRAGDRRQ